MASWDFPAVSSPSTANYAAPTQDFSPLANLLQDFVKGRQMGRQEARANSMRNGIPTVNNVPGGPIDLRRMADDQASIGGPDYAMPLIDMMVKQGIASDNANAVRHAQSMAEGASNSNVGAPASSQTSASPRVVTPLPASSTPAAPQAAASRPQATVRSVLAATNAVPNYELEAASESLARQLGVDGPSAVIDTQDPQVRNVLGPAIAQLKRMHIGEVVSSPQPVGQPAPSVQAPSAPAGPPLTPNQRVAQGTIPSPATGDLAKADRLDQAANYLLSQAAAAEAFDPKSGENIRAQAQMYHDQAKQIRDQAAPAPSIKEWQQSGSNLPYDDWVAQTEGDKQSAKDVAAADVKEQQGYIDAGKEAKNRLTTLNAMSNVVSGDNNVGYGFGGETELKVKQIAKRLGIDTGDLSGAELIKKLNSNLASEMAKTLTARPTQFDFKIFLQNNPGLEITKSGNQRLIGIYQQLAQREVDLGKLARQNRDNWSNWDSIVEKYDADPHHQIRDPISGQPITTDSIIEPGPKPTAQPQQRAAAQPVGPIATNPQTGQRLTLREGKWVPLGQ